MMWWVDGVDGWVPCVLVNGRSVWGRGGWVTCVDVCLGSGWLMRVCYKLKTINFN